MNQERVKVFLEALKTDPKAESLLQARPEPKTDADRFRAYAEIAKELGYDVSEAELEAYLTEMEKTLQEHAKSAEALVTELSGDEMDKVAGGAHTECKTTFLDRENCWHNDGCDNIYNGYKKYLCKKNGLCDRTAYSLTFCDGAMF